MPLVSNVEELQELLGTLELPISNIDQLRDLLQMVQQPDSQDPAVRQEWAAWRERQQTAAEVARDQAHAERMRALELGHGLPDSEAVIKGRVEVLNTTAEAAGWLGGFVTLGALGAAVGATAILVGVQPEYLVPALGILWGVCGLVGLVTALVSLGVLRRLRVTVAPSPETPKSTENPPPVTPGRKTFNDNKPFSENVA